MRERVLLFVGTVACSLMCGLTFSGETEAAVTPKLKTKNITLTEGKAKTICITGKRIKSKKFESTKKSVASVSKKGKVTAKKKGKCKIKITVKYYKKSKKRKLSVKKWVCPVQVKEGKKTTRPQLQVSDTFVKQMADTSIEMMKRNAGDCLKQNRNVLISPESVMTAMAMAVNGAAGNTLSEMQNSLYGGMSVEEFNKNMMNYNDTLVLSNQVKFHLANSIWFKKGLESIGVKEDYIEKNQKYFHSQFFQEPFTNDTVTKMNEWVSENTEKMIPSIINEIPEEVGMYLINALCFQGRWKEQYRKENVKEETFTSATGEKQKVSMLNSTERAYIEDEKAIGVMKDYEGSEYAFAAILPKEGITVADYLNAMTGDSFRALMKSVSSPLVETKIPSFSCEYETDMKQTMQDMGIKEAFLPTADFSYISSIDFYINSIVHKTKIELDQYGTKAAAATAIAMAMSSVPVGEPKKVYLDRPFIYAIVEKQTSLPIFIGVLNSVEG